MGDLTHAVIIVGWGNNGQTDYVIIKNSFGANWGEGGFVNLQIDGREGACGVLIDLVIPFTN